ncbi:hypothetical protein HDF19_06540 [Mucilaginibacter sp. E4BP6]|uniref:hypothetical protein n=1 Tax=Mucilaginibacter sp. E4BP6 TaxID=2723089 RepID=UPI0015CA6F83|nr:hypothetical protein [Mucilaginibacter sp. E4BP6]NYE68302.1 hypothetical protein [Mucilaginibacter sp. E4BP6]
MSTNNLNEDPEGTIPVNDAVQLTANWRTYLATSGQAFVTQSFLIPIIDFKNILEHNANAQSVRAYIGLSDPTDPLSAQLLLVPVSEGQDVVYLPKGHGDSESATLKSNVYDLTTACPPICPMLGSPLSE